MIDGSGLFDWMLKRHDIWVRRSEGKPKPWTADPILQQYRFCNVFRELDTVTLWIRDNIRIPFATHPYLWFMLAIARTINHPPTLAELIGSRSAWPSSQVFHPNRMTELLDARKARGEQVYTGAYMIRAESDSTKPWYSWTKQRYISEIVLGRLWDDRRKLEEELDSARTLRETWALLAQEPHYIGWGPFMSYEWVTDLRHTHYLRDAEDIMDWANAGPGALRGLRRLMTEDGSLHPQPLSAAAALGGMRVLLQHAKAHKLAFVGWDATLEMRDIEHSLCEFDKYTRVQRDEGRPRAKYQGT
jgi:hypothetical protein